MPATGTAQMNNQPKTIKQLRNKLDVAYIDSFPYGKHKDQLVANVVKEDPNYIVWWNCSVKALPIDPALVKVAHRNYKPLKKSGHWVGCIGPWDHWE